jgi:hypothetical protein
VIDFFDGPAGPHPILPGRRTWLGPPDGSDGFLDAIEAEDEDEADQAKKHVHNHASRNDEHALQDALGLEGARVGFFLVALGPFAHHVHITAQRQNADHVGGFAEGELAPGHRGAKANRERLDLHIAPLGGQEMAQLVDEDKEAQTQGGQGRRQESLDAHLTEEEAQRREDN